MRFRKLRIAWSVVWGTIFFTMLVGRLKELFGGIHYPTMPSDILIALTVRRLRALEFGSASERC